MRYTILKNEIEYKKFTAQENYSWIPSPTHYPAIVIKSQEDPEISWNNDSVKMRRKYDFYYIYPDEIQKELYDASFEGLIK
jgi:hypothetical protein